jgi:hypothetical protein
MAPLAGLGFGSSPGSSRGACAGRCCIKSDWCVKATVVKEATFSHKQGPPDAYSGGPLLCEASGRDRSLTKDITVVAGHTAGATRNVRAGTARVLIAVESPRRRSLRVATHRAW